MVPALVRLTPTQHDSLTSEFHSASPAFLSIQCGGELHTLIVPLLKKWAAENFRVNEQGREPWCFKPLAVVVELPTAAPANTSDFPCNFLVIHAQYPNS